MRGFLLLIPFFLIRFGLLSILNKEAVKRAAHFPPFRNKERIAYWVYQFANAVILIYLCFLNIKTDSPVLLYAGIVVIVIGTALLILSVIHFAAPSESGINDHGIYRFSRNPMYLAYFFYFIGCALLTQSLLLFGFVLVFQIAAHWIILAEERWCIKQFGLQYMNSVRRYI